MAPLHKAMILAAGLSTRLRPLSNTVPKPALPVLNRPLIHHVLDWLTGQGVRQVGVNLHHLGDFVRRTVGEYDGPRLDMHFSWEDDELLLTAAPLRDHADWLTGGDTFVLVNGKILTDIRLEPALEFHRAAGNLATLVLLPNINREPFNHVSIAPDGQITGFHPYDEVKHAPGDLNLFTGVHLLEPAVLDFLPSEGPYDTVRDLYPRLMSAGQPLGGFIASGSWREFSTLERYWMYNMELLKQSGRSRLEGSGAVINPGAILESAVLGDEVRIESGAELKECVCLGDNRIGAGAVLHQSVVGPGVRVPPGTEWIRKVLTTAEPDSASKSDSSLVATELELQ